MANPRSRRSGTRSAPGQSSVQWLAGRRSKKPGRQERGTGSSDLLDDRSVGTKRSFVDVAIGDDLPACPREGRAAIGQVEAAAQGAAPTGPFEHQQLLRGLKDVHRAISQGCICPAYPQAVAGERQHRTLILQLRLDSEARVAFIGGQPWLSSRKSVVWILGGPRHRRARAVTAQSLGPIGDRLGIPEVLERNVHLRQPQLLALVQDDRSAKASEEQHLGSGEGVAVLGANPARNCSGGVVVFESPSWPAGTLWPVVRDARDELRGEGLGIKEIEPIGAVQATIALGEGLHFRERLLAADLGKREPIAIAVDHMP